jgi:hypothetical protein
LWQTTFYLVGCTLYRYYTIYRLQNPFQELSLRITVCVLSVHAKFQKLPPISQVPVSFAAEESIWTLSLSFFVALKGCPGRYPMVSAYTGKCVCPYGELKHSWEKEVDNCLEDKQEVRKYREDNQIWFLLGPCLPPGSFENHFSCMLQIFRFVGANFSQLDHG